MSALRPTRPRSLRLSILAMPRTTEAKMIGAKSILMSLMKPSPSGFNSLPKWGAKAPTAIPAATAIKTWTENEPKSRLLMAFPRSRSALLQAIAHGARHLRRVRVAAQIRRHDAAGDDRFGRRQEARRRRRFAEVLEHEGRRPEGRNRIGDALSGDVEGRAVDGLEHGGEAPLRVEVRRRSDPEAAGEGGGEIGEDV